jgi:hypothetical protein
MKRMPLLNPQQFNQIKVLTIVDYGKHYLLGYKAVQSTESLPTFRRNILPSSWLNKPSMIWQYIPDDSTLCQYPAHSSTIIIFGKRKMLLQKYGLGKLMV